jgi:hypothetical protein
MSQHQELKYQTRQVYCSEVMLDSNVLINLPEDMRAQVTMQHQFSLKMTAQLYSAKTSMAYGRTTKAQDIQLYEERGKPNELRVTGTSEFQVLFFTRTYDPDSFLLVEVSLEGKLGALAVQSPYGFLVLPLFKEETISLKCIPTPFGRTFLDTTKGLRP